MRSGHKLTLPFNEFKRRVHAAVQRKVRLFGDHGRPPGLFGIGPHRELIGRPTTAAPRGPMSAEINDAAAYSSVNLRSDFLPAQLTGTIHDPSGTRVHDLAAALNGQIVAVGESFTLKGDDAEQFSIMLPETAFRNGPNRVDLLSVTGSGGALHLVPLAHTG
jgi:hypothetical protein